MEMLLDKAKIYSNNQYVFQSIRGLGKYPHLEPSGIQKYLIKLGYKGRQRAHGWRRTARTQSVELLGVEEDLIKRQMGWIPENKVDKAYNQSFRLKERKEWLYFDDKYYGTLMSLLMNHMRRYCIQNI